MTETLRTETDVVVAQRIDCPDDPHRAIRGETTILIGALLVLAVSGLLVIAPSGSLIVPWLGWELPRSCVWHSTLGRDCPGCGLSRSFVAAAHGDLRAALRFHAVGTILFGLIALQVPFRAAQIARLRRGLRPLWSPRPWPMLCLMTVALLAQWAGRLLFL